MKVSEEIRVNGKKPDSLALSWFHVGRYWRPFLLAFCCVIFTGCSANPKVGTSIEPGFTLQDVMKRLGAPDQEQTFTMPAGAFFGPQEALVELVAAGVEVVEWQYEQDEDIRYIWFVHETNGAAGRWLVVAMGTFPTGAVY